MLLLKGFGEIYEFLGAISLQAIRRRPCSHLPSYTPFNIIEETIYGKFPESTLRAKRFVAE